MAKHAKFPCRHAANATNKADGAAGPTGNVGQTRRAFIGFFATAALLPSIGRAIADPLLDEPEIFRFLPERKYPLFDEATANVFPQTGCQSRIALKDSVVKLVQHGVIDQAKFLASQQHIARVPEELSNVLTEPYETPMRLTRDNASDYVNLLWPIGLANYMDGNAASPILGPALPSFASTAGWTLGKRKEGSAYFNSFPIVELTPPQETLAIRVAQSTFRPCCDNSTFFQDCNHGSALFGVLQLGASQGLQDDDLYRDALAFNSFWFPEYYIRIALYFKVIRKTEWRNVDPKTVMSSDFSALGSWKRNVEASLEAIPDLIPTPQERLQLHLINARRTNCG